MPDRPNIVFLFPDQLRRDFLSCYGADFIQTPHIDSVAEQGVRYENAYSASPLCVPARTALLTGMSAIRNGVTDNLHAIRSDYNEAGIRTWPQILSDVGYVTSAIGKMHFYPWDAQHGFQYRVACEDKLWARIQDDYHHYMESHGLQKLERDEYGDYIANRGSAITDIPWEHSWDRFTGREARRFIDGYEGEGPFALMVGFPGPHDPYDPATDFPHRFEADDMPDPIPAPVDDPAGLRAAHTRARGRMGMDITDWTKAGMKDVRAHYAGLVKQIDHEVGEIIESLRARDLLDNTAIIFATDHGDHLGDYGMEGKATFYESACHIPLLVRPPGGSEPSVSEDLVELRDVTATMLGFSGVELPLYMDSQPVPGLGLPERASRQRIFGMLTRGWMAFDGRWKLCKYFDGEPLLFDLETDPTEERNLAGDPAYGHAYRRLDEELTREIMEAMAVGLHDRLVAPASLSTSDDFAREGWRWRFPADASEATKVGDDYY